MTDQQKINECIELIANFAYIDGEHHKQWLIAKVARILVGEKEWEANWKGRIDEGVAP